MEKIEYFEVTETGELIKIDGKQFSGGFDGDNGKVYIVIENDARLIFLWKGVTAGVRQKFIGSRATGDTRKEYGYHYKIVVMDADDEDSKFIEYIRGGQEAEVSGSRAETFDAFGETSEEQFESYAEQAEKQGILVDEKEVAAITGESVNLDAPAHIAKMGGIGVRPQRSFLSDPNFFSDVKDDKKTREKVSSVLQDVNKKDAMEIVNALGLPKGYEREMLIVGQTVYRVDYDGDNVVLDELDNPLDGVIMVSQFVPRILAENGKIKAVELLTQTSEDVEVDESLTQDLSDLTAMFQIEIE
ncbi:MAG: hypothetical protein ACXAE3_16730 [Candidatus Kariarchaeaceae archaeon]|jgi:hypothetical protein